MTTTASEFYISEYVMFYLPFLMFIICNFIYPITQNILNFKADSGFFHYPYLINFKFITINVVIMISAFGRN